MAGSKHNPVERLGEQVETLDDGFRTLAKAPNLKEMARLFGSVLGSHFPGAQVALFHAPSPGQAWQQLLGPQGDDVAATLGDTAVSRFTLRWLDGARKRAGVIQPLADGSSLGLLLGQAGLAAAFEEADKVSLQLSTQLFASAYQSLLHRKNEKDLIFSLNHRVLQLNSLIDTGIEVSKLKQEGSLPQLALARAASLTNASRGVLSVSAGDTPVEWYSFPAGDSPEAERDDKGCIQTSFRFSGTTYTFRLYEKESRSGVIPFDETDHLLLDALARQVHASLENRYLLQQMLDKQKIEQDIAVAAAIQKRILPEALPAIPGYDVFGTNIPTKSVGGDYYDCIPLPDGRIALVVADVAGKGIPAALLVSSFHAYLNAYLENNLPLIQLVQRLNAVICKASTDDKFITAFVALLDTSTGELESLNAGHNPVYLLRRGGTLEELNNGGVALGMMDMEFPFTTDEVTLAPGDRLFLYSDGLTEAMNVQEELYDNVRSVKQFILDHPGLTAKEFVGELISDVRQFVGSAPQADDITALYLVRY